MIGASACGRIARALALALSIALASGCASIPPTYTQQELEQRCVRAGGWWRPDQLIGGLCEFQSPGMI